MRKQRRARPGRRKRGPAAVPARTVDGRAYYIWKGRFGIVFFSWFVPILPLWLSDQLEHWYELWLPFIAWTAVWCFGAWLLRVDRFLGLNGKTLK